MNTEAPVESEHGYRANTQPQKQIGAADEERKNCNVTNSKSSERDCISTIEGGQYGKQKDHNEILRSIAQGGHANNFGSKQADRSVGDGQQIGLRNKG